MRVCWPGQLFQNLVLVSIPIIANLDSLVTEIAVLGPIIFYTLFTVLVVFVDVKLDINLGIPYTVNLTRTLEILLIT